MTVSRKLGRTGMYLCRTEPYIKLCFQDLSKLQLTMTGLTGGLCHWVFVNHCQQNSVLEETVGNLPKHPTVRTELNQQNTELLWMPWICNTVYYTYKLDYYKRQVWLWGTSSPSNFSFINLKCYTRRAYVSVAEHTLYAEGPIYDIPS